MTAAVITELPKSIFRQVKNNYSNLFWKFKKLNFPSRNRMSYFLFYITTALREFPWNYLGEGTYLVLSLAFKNSSGYQNQSACTCLSWCPNLSYSIL